MTIFFFLFGAIIGSFLNVVILRHNTGLSISGRSSCMACSKVLRWYELIPILSYISLRGKCSRCSTDISTQYPLVELATAIIFAGLFVLFQDLFVAQPLIFWVLMILHMIMISLLVIIFVYDIYHKIIPDKFSYSFAFIALVLTLSTQPLSLDTAINTLNLFSGILLFIPFYLLWLISGGRWIGLGDAKLALGIGWLLGFIHGISALVIAFWTGAIVSVFMLLIQQLKGRGNGITMKSEVPFAPFLIFGTLIELFFRFDVLGLGFLIGY